MNSPIKNFNWAAASREPIPLLLPDKYRMLLRTQFDWDSIDELIVILDKPQRSIDIRRVSSKFKSAEQVALEVSRLLVLNPDTEKEKLESCIKYILSHHTVCIDYYDLNNVYIEVLNLLPQIDRSQINNHTLKYITKPGWFTTQQLQSIAGKLSSNSKVTAQMVYDVQEKLQGQYKILNKGLAILLKVSEKTIKRRFKENPELSEYKKVINSLVPKKAAKRDNKSL